MNPPWRDQRECAVEGCQRRAAGTNPLCRAHARQVPRDEYRRLRFLGDEKQLAEIVARMETT